MCRRSIGCTWGGRSDGGAAERTAVLERHHVRVPDAALAVARRADSSSSVRLSRRGAEQIAYAQRRGVPWGISESGYYRFDAQQNYQYRAFGVPALGFKRGLEDDLVIAPYACALAVRVAPQAVLENVGVPALDSRGGTVCTKRSIARRAPAAGPRSGIVRSYMAHHQGMILVALNNHLNGEPMQRRFHRIRWCEPPSCWCSSAPDRAPIEQTRPEPARRRTAARPHLTMQPWPVPLDAEVPQVHVLSNGRYRVVVTEGGGGGSQWNSLALTRWSADTTLDNPASESTSETSKAGTSGRRSRRLRATPGALPSAHGRVPSRAHDIIVRQRVWVAPGDDVEIRHLTLSNEGRTRRRLEVTSYAEVVLATPPRTAGIRPSASCSSRVSISTTCTRSPSTGGHAANARAHAVSCT